MVGFKLTVGFESKLLTSPMSHRTKIMHKLCKKKTFVKMHKSCTSKTFKTYQNTYILDWRGLNKGPLKVN